MTTYTFLDGVNAVLKKVKVVQGEDGELASFTDLGRQTYVDLAIQAWNEVVQEAYTRGKFVGEPSRLSITLVASQRSYHIHEFMEQITWPLIDATNQQQIWPYPGGYYQMLQDQWITGADPPSPDNYTGLPYFAAILPFTKGSIWMDRTPTSNEAGRSYIVNYDARVVLANTGDDFPFTDTVVDAFVPAVAEIWKRDERGTFDDGIFKMSFARALRLMNESHPRTKW